MKESSTEELIG